MSLQIGQKLGSYEITSLLGKGGMGEVYRARDSKLKREVAIKALPDEFSRDHDRVIRFQREAEVLASLNHSHIASIYDLQEANESRFLIMEFVEGETLADQIAKGPLPVDEALNIAKQICEALGAAHEKGIVHRDLKPANIKITPNGHVKVLDFGLAKAREISPGNAPPSESPTLTAGATNAGVILGTAAYMSPEQARGRAVDRRTDVWALGCVLFELLTGKQTFSGVDVTDTIAAIVRADVDWNALPITTPASIRKLLGRCLQKDPARRLADVGDARLEIEDALESPELVARAATRSPGSRRERLAWILVAVLIIGFIAAAGFGVIGVRPTPAGVSAYRASILPPENAAFATGGSARFLALSPDGRSLAFVAAGQDGKQLIWNHSLEALNAKALPGTDGAEAPFWSPDSRWIGFFSGGKLKKVDTLGGAPVVISNVVDFLGTATWNRDGIILWGSTRTGIQRMTESGVGPTSITTPDGKAGEFGHAYPFFLPDDRHFLYFVVGRPGESGVRVGSLDSNEHKLLIRNDSNAIYGSGHLIFVRGGTLMAQPFDTESLQLRGEASPLGEQVTIGAPPVSGGGGTNTASQGTGGPGGTFSASQTGVLAYQGGQVRSQLTWFDRTGKPMGVVGEPNTRGVGPDPALAPDGRRVAVALFDESNNRDLWLIEIVRNVGTRFTFDAATDADPVWSSDGRQIVFRSARKGPGDLYMKSVSGASSEELLLESPQNTIPLDWSSDGRFLLYAEDDPKTRRDLWMLPMVGGTKPSVLVNNNFDEFNGQFSPDGRWVAYQSDESGRNEIYVRTFPEPGGRWQISTSGGIMPRWRQDGRELYYIDGNARLMATPLRPSGETLEVGAPVPLFQTQIPGGLNLPIRSVYVVSRDNRFLIFNPTGQTSFPITLLVNWQAGLKE